MEESDLAAAWEHEQRRAEVMAERDRCLADADQARAELAERIERNRQAAGSRVTAMDAVQPVTRAVAPRERPQPQPVQSHAEWSAGWNKWAIEMIDSHVSAAVKKYIEATVEGVGEATRDWFGAERDKTRAELKAAVDEVRTEITAAEERVRTSLSAEIRIAALEARLEAAERRAAPTPIRPRLVDGGGDAA